MSDAALIVSVSPGETRAMLVLDDRPVDLVIDRASRPSRVGALYRARIVQIMPALPAMMLDSGEGPAFLPGTTLPDGTAPVEGAAVIVELVKDGFDTKPPEASARWSVRGSYLALSSGKAGIVLSKKLPEALRARLGSWLEASLRADESIVVRSVAETLNVRDHEAAVAILDAELAALRAERQRIQSSRTLGRLDRPQPLIARLLASFPSLPRSIVVNDPAVFAAARSGLTADAAARLLLDAAPGFDERHGIDAAFDDALARFVTVEGGVRLAFDRTTGYLAVDVDLGAAAGSAQLSRAAIAAANEAAARRLARELRLRDVGGAAVIDFIGTDRAGRDEIAKTLEAAVADDPAGVQILGWTRLGHLELTRRRVQPSLADIVCGPAGSSVQPSAESIALVALRRLARAQVGGGALVLVVHPAVRSLIETTFAEAFDEASREAGRRATLAPDPTAPIDRIDLVSRLPEN